MEKYIIITEFGEQQDIRVGLKSCKNKYNLLLCWAKHLSYPYIGIKSKTKLIEDIKFDLREFKQYVMNARSYMTNFYNESYLVNGIHIELYVVKREQNCDSSFLFKIFVFYKNWDFLVEKEYNSPFDALVDSINIIQWDEFSQEEKNEFEKVLKSTSHVNCVIRNLVWNFECSILSNNLKVYITLYVHPNIVIKDLTASIQNRVKEAIKKTSDLETKAVNVKIRNITPKTENTVEG